VGFTRYMATADHRDEATDRQYRAGEFVTGSEFERLGEPSAFAGADYPEDVAQLREEHGLDEQTGEAEAPSYVDSDDLEGKTVEELRELAAAREIEGRSSMNKAELVDALR
jgi:Rho termination factor, N-terminal domain